ncbi:carbamoyltransferase C-terminal domain-containing protein [Lignipirellula cremea]|uniref:Decarbamoylnovobiocin carbamoyltransferase n=1 Tax=Lignipirellula cremea TaxID=2528010 RepID=A0A518DQN2_9BACT|nr:carbamoyltransferase C-terminal domain-containing protein [Lignipirellula cremea]QDU94147.1 Decarbamoylnovobiocin carbamoyltransferase [Lignipirellula cremea]
MYVLGINSVYHESAACLLDNGRLVAIAEEERFNRVKHGKKPLPDNPDQLPLRSIDYCLRTAGIDLRQVAHIGYSSHPDVRVQRLSGDALDMAQYFCNNIRKTPENLRDMGFAGEFHFIDHHVCHAASAFYPSPFEEAAILTIDGIGDASTTTSHHGVGSQMTLIQEIIPHNSIGFLWELVSMFLGFDIYDATKIMGLAAYGDPSVYRDAFSQIIKATPDGKFEVDSDLTRFYELDYYNASGYFGGLEKVFGLPRRNPKDELTQAYKDISATLQDITDEIVLHITQYLFEKTQSKNLCVAGGVALNCVTNQRIFEQGPFEQLYIQPVAHDGGTAIGAAFYLWHQQLKQPRQACMEHPYWGPEFTTEEIEQALQDRNLTYTRVDQIEDEVARLISEGAVVGWFQGRMEVGPRALGNRSLLADPRNPQMRDMLNHKVKHREFFRPFAPSVLLEEASNWFQIEKENMASEFMLMAYAAHDHLVDKIPAVAHVDGTCRVQLVRQTANPKYHRLISSFFERTGVPMVLNTSFNDSEPIVCSPADAVHTFMKTRIDYLAIGDFLVSKEQNPGPPWEADSAERKCSLQRVLPALHEVVDKAVWDMRLTRYGDIWLATEKEQNASPGSAPIYVEQQLLAGALQEEPLAGKRVLDLSLNAGLLAISAAQAGAKVTALASGPITLPAFNVALNGVHANVEILPRTSAVYQPVTGKKFDWIVGTVNLAPRITQAVDSAAVALGLGPLASVLFQLDTHLAPGGQALIAGVVPGDEQHPHLLSPLLESLAGAVTVRQHPDISTYKEMLDWLVYMGQLPKSQSDLLLLRASQENTTHAHMCLVHYAKDQPHVVTSEPLAPGADDWRWTVRGLEWA